MSQLLNRDPATRLGANGTKAIKDHPFFADVDFKRLLQKRYTPPFRPNVVSVSISFFLQNKTTNLNGENAAIRPGHVQLWHRVH